MTVEDIKGLGFKGEESLYFIEDDDMWYTFFEDIFPKGSFPGKIHFNQVTGRVIFQAFHSDGIDFLDKEGMTLEELAQEIEEYKKGKAKRTCRSMD